MKMLQTVNLRIFLHFWVFWYLLRYGQDFIIIGSLLVFVCHRIFFPKLSSYGRKKLKGKFTEFGNPITENLHENL